MLYMMTCIVAMVAFREHKSFNGFKHLFIPLFGLAANLVCMLFYLVGPFMVTGMSVKEPYIALGACAVWGVYGAVYFLRNSRAQGACCDGGKAGGRRGPGASVGGGPVPRVISRASSAMSVDACVVSLSLERRTPLQDWRILRPGSRLECQSLKKRIEPLPQTRSNCLLQAHYRSQRQPHSPSTWGRSAIRAPSATTTRIPVSAITWKRRLRPGCRSRRCVQL